MHFLDRSRQVRVRSLKALWVSNYQGTQPAQESICSIALTDTRPEWVLQAGSGQAIFQSDSACIGS